MDTAQPGPGDGGENIFIPWYFTNSCAFIDKPLELKASMKQECL